MVASRWRPIPCLPAGYSYSEKFGLAGGKDD